jgi:hypothetical protein
LLKSTYDYIITICYVWLIMMAFFIIITIQFLLLIGLIFPVLIMLVLQRERNINNITWSPFPLCICTLLIENTSILKIPKRKNVLPNNWKLFKIWVLINCYYFDNIELIYDNYNVLKIEKICCKKCILYNLFVGVKIILVFIVFSLFLFTKPTRGKFFQCIWKNII